MAKNLRWKLLTILGVIALAFLYQFAVSGEITLASAGRVGLYIVLFVVLAPIAAKIVAWVIDHYDRRSASPGLLVTMVVSLIMLFSYLAHLVGAPLILGGFAAGIAMGQRFQLSVAQRLGIPFTPALNRILAAALKRRHLHTRDQRAPASRPRRPARRATGVADPQRVAGRARRRAHRR